MNKVPLISYFESYEDMSRAACQFLLDEIGLNKRNVLGAATGYSPQLLYAMLCEDLLNRQELLNDLFIVQLDEWLGISDTDNRSCRHYLLKHLIFPLSLYSDRFISIDGKSCEDGLILTQTLSQMQGVKMNLCVLGLGANGHLALNEPGSEMDSIARVVELEDRTKEHSMLHSKFDKPSKGITVGIEEILRSDCILLLVTGDDKKQAFKNLIDKKDPSKNPSSYLHFHNNVHCFVDKSSI